MRKISTALFLAGSLGSASAIAGTPAPTQSAGAILDELKRGAVGTTYVQRRGGRVGGFRGRGFGGRNLAGRGFTGRRGVAGRGFYGRRGVGAGAVVGGLAAGALVGGALGAAAGPGIGYEAPLVGQGTAPGRDDACCTQRFRSYDPASGTYLGYDGQHHPCP